MEKIHVIKIGGNVIDHPEKLRSFLADFSHLKGMKILVHGGGKIATEMSKTLGIVPQMVDGRRITDDETLKVVTMIYAGLINKNIVAQLQTLHCNAIGLCGADGNLIPAQKRIKGDIDYGWVGDPIEIKEPHPLLTALLKENTVPVFPAITHDQQGHLLNTNADTIAATLAIRLASSFETHLVYCFEKKGVLKDVNDENSVIHFIDPHHFQQLKQEHIIFEGMIPKLENAFDAIHKGVKTVRIGLADDLLQLNQGENFGTCLKPLR